MFRKKVVRAVLVSFVCFVATVWPSNAYAADTCQTDWGSLSKQASIDAVDRSVVSDVRAGRHSCYDRLVIDLEGSGQGFRVAYVDQIVEDGRGDIVPLRGGAFLEIIANAPAYTDQGVATYDPSNASEAVSVSGYQTLRQVAFASSFEGTTQFGVGVRARLPFRVFTLEGPGSNSRIVIDVAHRW